MTATTFPTTEPAWLDIDAPLGTLLRQVAAAAARRLLRRIESGGGATPNGLDLADAIEAIGEAAIAEATRKSYAGALRRFGRWLDGGEVSDDLLVEYLDALYDAGKSYNSADHIVAALKRSARELRDSGRCVASPVGPATRLTARAVSPRHRRANVEAGRGHRLGGRRQDVRSRRIGRRTARRWSAPPPTACCASPKPRLWMPTT